MPAMAQLRALGNSLRQPAVASSGRLEAGRSGAARGHRVARTVLAAAAAQAAAAALGRMVLPLMARLLSGSKTQAKQPSPEDRVRPFNLQPASRGVPPLMLPLWRALGPIRLHNCLYLRRPN